MVDGSPAMSAVLFRQEQLKSSVLALVQTAGLLNMRSIHLLLVQQIQSGNVIRHTCVSVHKFGATKGWLAASLYHSAYFQHDSL